MKKENIVYDGEVMAMIVYAGTVDPGVHFYAEDQCSLQVGKQRRLKGERITPHRHLAVKVERTETLKEVLYVEKGKVKTIFYTEQWDEVGSRILNGGDMILLIKGGHGFEMLEETVMVEIKEGPYNPASTQKKDGDS